MIRVGELTVAFGKTVAINHLSVTVGPGVFGLFGPNGSGKSTLLRAIAGLVRPTAGSVEVGGTTVNLGDEGFRRGIGYAGHEPGLYGRLTARENLILFGGLCGADKARVDDVIEALDLGRFAAVRVEDLSAGTRRRVSVGRALLHEPPVLLLDEPYANVDDDSAGLISAALQPWKSDDRVALVATHGAKRVKAFANGGVILRDGRLVIEGRYDHPGEVGTGS